MFVRWWTWSIVFRGLWLGASNWSHNKLKLKQWLPLWSKYHFQHPLSDDSISIRLYWKVTIVHGVIGKMSLLELMGMAEEFLTDMNTSCRCGGTNKTGDKNPTKYLLRILLSLWRRTLWVDDFVAVCWEGWWETCKHPHAHALPRQQVCPQVHPMLFSMICSAEEAS